MVSEPEGKFLIYVDILGFEILPRKIAEVSHFDEDDIREKHFFQPFRERIDKINKYSKELTKGIDDCLFAFACEDDLVRCIHDLSTIPIHIHHQPEIPEEIPVEIAIDFVPISSKVKSPVNSASVISALKSDILPTFKSDYKKAHNGNRIEETFVLATPSAHTQLFGNNGRDLGSGVRERYQHIPTEFFPRKYKELEFFGLVGVERNDYTGSAIDRVFIEPIEFDRIEESLKRDHIVVVSGPPGFGKTYLALRLLWLWFNEGYTPKWIRVDTDPKNGKESEDKLERFCDNLEAKITDNDIVYVEDPFGSASFTKNETLIKRLSATLDYVKRKDTHLIITSRKDVLEEFVKVCYQPGKLRILEHELNFIAPSYDYEKRKEICERWAEEKACLWLRQDTLKDYVLDALQDSSLLPTPLSIHDFINATVSIEAKDPLYEKICEYSLDSWASFGREVLNLCESGRDDRILLLSFVYIFGSSSLSFLETEYNAFKKPDYEEFDRLFAEEKRHRLTMRCWPDDDNVDGLGPADYTVEFAHSSYERSLEYLIRQRCFGRIFFPVLEHLYKNRREDIRIPKLVHDYYPDFPRLLRERIIYNHLLEDINNRPDEQSANGFDRDLFDNRQEGRALQYPYHFVSPEILATVIERFTELPLPFRQLLFTVSENSNNSRFISASILVNYRSVPQQLKDLLFQLARQGDTSGGVAEAIYLHFLDVPEELRLHLIRVLMSQIKNDDRIRILTDYYDHLPSSITDQLFVFTACDDCAENLSNGIAINYQYLPGKIKEILFTLAENEETARHVGSALHEFFSAVPESDRNTLLEILSAKHEATYALGWIFVERYHEIPADLRKRIFRFLLDHDDVSSFMQAVALNYPTLPKYVQKTLLRFAGSRTRAIDVADAIVSELEYEKIPKEIRKQILLKLSVQPVAKSTVIWCIYDYWTDFDKPFLRLMIDNLLFNNPVYGNFSWLFSMFPDNEVFDEDTRNAILEEAI